VDRPVHVWRIAEPAKRAWKLQCAECVLKQRLSRWDRSMGESAVSPAQAGDGQQATFRQRHVLRTKGCATAASQTSAGMFRSLYPPWCELPRRLSRWSWLPGPTSTVYAPTTTPGLGQLQARPRLLDRGRRAYGYTGPNGHPLKPLRPGCELPPRLSR
jgi:hypothetical protein